MATLEDKLTLRCIHSLDGMKNGLKDERPKLLSKLKNALQKDTKLLYVSSILNAVFTCDSPIEISQVDNIDRDDEQLDKEIAEQALKRAKECGRKVMVLPCDSNLHSKVAAQIQKWYEVKDSIADVDHPVNAITMACSLDYELSPEQLIGELARLGVIITDGTTVAYSLPDPLALKQLESALEKWEQKIKEKLSETSAKNYHSFALLLLEANTALQNKMAGEINLYCEDQFGKRYAFYKKTRTQSVNAIPMQSLTVQDMDTSPVTIEETVVIPKELPNRSTNTLPLGLQPEVAYALIHLSNANPRPTTPQQLVEHTRAVCDVTYIVSPKYILPDIGLEEKFTGVYNEDFTINVHLAKRIKKSTIFLKDTRKLAVILSYPGKDKEQQKASSKTNYRRSHSMQHSRQEPMDTTGSDGDREIFQGFQQYIYTNSKTVAQRNNSILVLNDSDAQARCMQNVLKWCAPSLANPNVVITDEDLSRQLIKLSYEEGHIPSDTLIQYLMKVGYLEINDQSVVYKTNFRRPTDVENPEEVTKFLAIWEADYRPSDSSKESTDFPFSRKRTIARMFSSGSKTSGSKKQKIINV